MKTLSAPRERNHLVALALFRRAGAHRKSNKAARQQFRRETKELSKCPIPG